MSEVGRPRSRSYLVAMASLLVAALLRWLLDPVLGDRLPYVTFFLAVLFTAWSAGLRPALLAIVLGGMMATYFFVPPRGTFWIADVEHQITLGVYALVGLVAALLSEALRKARQHAEELAATAQQHRAALQRSEARYRQILETAQEGIWLIDARTRHSM